MPPAVATLDAARARPHDNGSTPASPAIVQPRPRREATANYERHDRVPGFTRLCSGHISHMLGPITRRVPRDDHARRGGACAKGQVGALVRPCGAIVSGCK